MDPGLKAAAVRVFAEVLADFAYVFGDPVPGAELPALQGDSYLARLPFRGGVTGTLTLAVPDALAREIAANTLGIDVADPDVAARAPDAVRELASVMGGHLVAGFGPLAVEVVLAPPELLTLGARDWEGLRTDPATLCFRVNEHPALLRVLVEQGGGAS